MTGKVAAAVLCCAVLSSGSDDVLNHQLPVGLNLLRVLAASERATWNLQLNMYFMMIGQGLLCWIHMIDMVSQHTHCPVRRCWMVLSM